MDYPLAVGRCLTCVQPRTNNLHNMMFEWNIKGFQNLSRKKWKIVAGLWRIIRDWIKCGGLKNSSSSINILIRLIPPCLYILYFLILCIFDANRGRRFYYVNCLLHIQALATSINKTKGRRVADTNKLIQMHV